MSGRRILPLPVTSPFNRRIGLSDPDEEHPPTPRRRCVVPSLLVSKLRRVWGFVHTPTVLSTFSTNLFPDHWPRDWTPRSHPQWVEFRSGRLRCPPPLPLTLTHRLPSLLLRPTLARSHLPRHQIGYWEDNGKGSFCLVGFESVSLTHKLLHSSDVVYKSTRVLRWEFWFRQ